MSIQTLELGMCVCRDGWGEYCKKCMPAYRMRRGKLVEIPWKWRGVVTRPQTIRKRLSKQTRKLRNTQCRRWGKGGLRWSDKYIRFRREGPPALGGHTHE